MQIRRRHEWILFLVLLLFFGCITPQISDGIYKDMKNNSSQVDDKAKWSEKSKSTDLTSDVNESVLNDNNVSYQEQSTLQNNNITNQSNETVEEFNPIAAGSPHPKIKVSPPPCCNHPYWHKVYRAFSDDGLTWEKENFLIKEHTSVPAILQKDDETFILYYVDGKIDTFDCAVSSDGMVFSDGNCTIYGFTEEKAWDPYIVKLDNGFYRLYFFAPLPGPPSNKENRIMSAISKDGINWLQEEGVRFQYKNILDPAVIKIGNVWRMYAWYGYGGPGNVKLVIAKSDDGLNFTKETELSIIGGVPEIVKLDSGEYALYFCGEGIQVMTSVNGIDWANKKLALQPDPSSIVCDPTVIKTKDGWMMYYKKQDAPLK